MKPFTFRVTGNPRPQGSLTRNQYGAVYQKADLVEWRNLVAWTALAAARQSGNALPLDEPLIVDVTFWLPRPKKPRWEVPATALDLDKLIRAIGDALSPRRGAKVVSNDSRIVRWGNPTKHYADKDNPPGVEVTIRPWQDDTP